MWKLKGIRRNADKRRCPLCVGEEDVEHILLDCLETINWRMKCLNKKYLNMNKQRACRRILRSTNKDQIRNLGRYLGKVKYNSLIKQKNCKYISYVSNGCGLPP
jgi:hypothetical protein